MSKKSSGNAQRSAKKTKSVNSVPREQSIYSIGSSERVQKDHQPRNSVPVHEMEKGFTFTSSE